MFDILMFVMFDMIICRHYIISIIMRLVKNMTMNIRKENVKINVSLLKRPTKGLWLTIMNSGH